MPCPSLPAWAALNGGGRMCHARSLPGAASPLPGLELSLTSLPGASVSPASHPVVWSVRAASPWRRLCVQDLHIGFVPDSLQVSTNSGVSR